MKGRSRHDPLPDPQLGAEGTGKDQGRGVPEGRAIAVTDAISGSELLVSQASLLEWGVIQTGQEQCPLGLS